MSTSRHLSIFKSFFCVIYISDILLFVFKKISCLSLIFFPRNYQYTISSFSSVAVVEPTIDFPGTGDLGVKGSEGSTWQVEQEGTPDRPGAVRVLAKGPDPLIQGSRQSQSASIDHSRVTDIVACVRVHETPTGPVMTKATSHPRRTHPQPSKQTLVRLQKHSSL